MKRAAASTTRTPAQLSLGAVVTRRRAKDGSLRGGARKGAGRKPTAQKARVTHLRRPAHAASKPLHLSMKAAPGVPNLRRPAIVRVITTAFARFHASQRDAEGVDLFRVTDFSIQDTHIHLVAEAQSKEALVHAMRCLSIVTARAINKATGRRGQVWGDRYYARTVSMPKEMRHLLVYVLLNSQKHNPGRLPLGRKRASERALIDVHCTSAASFQGFSKTFAVRQLQSASNASSIVAAPRTWLRCTGWRAHGLIDPRIDRPKSAS